MTDGAGLSGSTAALYGSNHVIDSSCAGQFQRLFNDNFKSFQVKVIIKLHRPFDYDIPCPATRRTLATDVFLRPVP